MQNTSVTSATTSGTRLDVLLAIRHSLADAIDVGATPRDLAALTRRLIDVDAEVRALQAENDPVAAAQAAKPAAWTD